MNVISRCCDSAMYISSTCGTAGCSTVCKNSHSHRLQFTQQHSLLQPYLGQYWDVSTSVHNPLPQSVCTTSHIQLKLGLKITFFHSERTHFHQFQQLRLILSLNQHCRRVSRTEIVKISKQLGKYLTVRKAMTLRQHVTPQCRQREKWSVAHNALPGLRENLLKLQQNGRHISKISTRNKETMFNLHVRR